MAATETLSKEERDLLERDTNKVKMGQDDGPKVVDDTVMVNGVEEVI